MDSVQPKEKKVCGRCIMDTTAADISFDEQGNCNFCSTYLEQRMQWEQGNEPTEVRHARLIEAVKADGKGKEYDCVIGVSGGADSSYALLSAKKAGLRPLAVHLDNGWDSEFAVKNIENLVKRLNVDLYTHVIDWEEFRDIQLSFFKAQVIDLELPTDNAILAICYQMAEKFGLHYILAGHNHATEGIPLPINWSHYKYDARNIRRIQKKFGTLEIKTLPLISVLKYFKYRFVERINWVSYLDYLDYNKSAALLALQAEVGYVPYQYKHYESVFTRFYQGSILPEKFGVDKRKLHLSTLIASGQMSQEEAQQLMRQSPYQDQNLLKTDREYVIKKLGFTDASFSEYVKAPEESHFRYGSEKGLWKILVKVYHAAQAVLPRKTLG